MKTRKRFVVSLVLALLIAVMVTNVAFAFHCSNPNLNDNALLGEVNVFTGEVTLYKDNGSVIDLENDIIIVHGAWFKLVVPGVTSFNIFVRGVLPDGAMNSGPGDNGCDGKGIDDIDACFAMFG